MNELDYLAAVVRDAFARLGCSMAGKVRAINNAIEEQHVFDGTSSSIAAGGTDACRDDLFIRSSLNNDMWLDASFRHHPGNIHYDPFSND